MASPESPVCPVLALALNKDLGFRCVRDRCAWWVSRDNATEVEAGCAMLGLFKLNLLLDELMQPPGDSDAG